MTERQVHVLVLDSAPYALRSLPLERIKSFRAHGTVGSGFLQAYVDGKPYKGDFHKIPLKAHTLITLAYNSPNVKPDTTYNWNGL